MKKPLKKFVTTMLIVLLLFNFIYSTCTPAYAFTIDDVGTGVTNLLGGVVGLFAKIITVPAIAVAFGANVLTAQIAYMDGETDIASSGDGLLETIGDRATLTPFEIFFNEIQLLDVNFLDTDVGGTTGIIRKSVAQWYYVMRLIASIILLVILIFVGVKMALSSVAEEKAIYKKTLIDWATSLALVFVLQYIIMFAVNTNSAIVLALKGAVDTTAVDPATGEVVTTSINDIIGDIAIEAIFFTGWRSIGATIVYCMFVFQTVAFLFTYIKRMLTVGFLIIISPLISITYSIDRMGDGKAQALNTWLKEFIYGILIQPFHCVMYIAFINTAFNLLKTSGANSLASAVLAILCMKFIDEGEKIVRKIFGFEQASSVSPIQTAAAAGLIMKGGKMAAGAATNARKAINMAKEKGLIASVKKDMENRKDRKLERQVDKRMKKDYSSLKKDSEEYNKVREKVKEQIGEKEAAKPKPIRKLADSIKSKREEKKNKAKEDAISKQLEENYGGKENVEKFRNSATGDEWNEAYKLAESQVNTKEDEKNQKRKETGKKIKGAVGTVGGAFGKAWNSNTGKYIRKTAIPAGIGFAIGSMAYGGTDLFTSIGAGNTVFKGVQGFVLNSPKTLAEEASKYIDKRTSNKEETIIKCEEVYQKGEAGVYNSGSDDMKDILNQLKAVLNAMGKSKDFSHLKSKIAYEATANPETFDLNSILKEMVGSDALSNKKLVDAAQEFADFTLDSNLYKQLKNGTDLGMDIDDLAKRLDRMIEHREENSNNINEKSDSSNTETENGSSNTENINLTIEKIIRNENIETIINEVDKKDVNQLQDLAKSLETKIDEIRRSSTEGDSTAEKSINRLNQVLNKVNTKLNTTENGS